MTRRASIAIAAKLTSGPRQTALQKLAAHRGVPLSDAKVVIATPRRFLSLRKLLKPNAAIDGMLQVMHTAADICAERGHPFAFALSDRPTASQGTALYLSHHTLQTPAFEKIAADGAQVLHFKAADLPQRTCFDGQGFAGWSSLASRTVAELETGVSPAEEARFFAQMRKAALHSRQSKYVQKEGPLELPERFVFVALQTIGDMVQRNAYIPMLDMLDMVAHRYSGSGVSVVVKRHPKCRSARVSKALAKYAKDENVLITNGSIHEIFERAQAVFTVNSGVGAESLVHGVPLFLFGAADYAPAAHHIRSEADLERLTQTLKPAVSEQELYRFLYYYRNIYQLRLDEELTPRLAKMIETAIGQAR